VRVRVRARARARARVRVRARARARARVRVRVREVAPSAAEEPLARGEHLRHQYTRLQPPVHAVTASGTCGYRPRP
jgi:hypothetical protein